MLAFLLKWWKEVNMPKRAQDPGDEAGRLDPIGPHDPNPPSHGRVSRGDVLEFPNLKGEYSEPDLAQVAFSSMQSMKARSAAGTWRRLG